jgi:hypothetical protein
MLSIKHNLKPEGVVGIIARTPRRTQLVKQELLEKLMAEAARASTNQANENPDNQECDRSSDLPVETCATAESKCPVAKLTKLFARVRCFFVGAK